jgi:hypothetical protein
MNFDNFKYILQSFSLKNKFYEAEIYSEHLQHYKS